MTEARWWIWYADFSYTAVTLAANLLLQTTLIVAAGLVSARLLRRRGAAVRSVVLRMSLCAALLCPVASWSLGIGGIAGIGVRLPTAPRAELRTERPIGSHSRHDAGSRFASDSSVYRRMDNPAPAFRDADQARVVSNSALPIRNNRRGDSSRAMEEDRVGSYAAAPTEASATGRSAVMPYRSEVSALSMVYCGLTAIWFATAAALMARIGIAYLALCASHRRFRAIGPRLKAECESLARKLGVPMPRLLVSDRITIPCLIGWWRPTILLPSNPDMITRDVLLHEMAHWARRDCLWNFVAVMAASVMFFQPLLWALRRRLAHVADDVCDDYVIVHGGDRRSYARQLVDIAEALQTAWTTRTVGVGVIASTSALADRVRRILDPLEGPSIRIGGGSLAVIACLAICGTLAVGMIGANGSEETREFAGSLEPAGPSPAKQTRGKSEAPKKPLRETSGDSRPTNPKSDSPIESLPPRVKESVGETKESVVMEWRKQYAHQQIVLQWPRNLGDDFVAAVRPLRPIETKVDFPTPPRQQLQIDFRHRYAHYVEHLLPMLARLIGSRWAPQSNATERKDLPGGRSQGTTDPQRKPEVVHWSPVDQKRLLENHFDWSSQSDGAPLTLQVLYAQEDLWVLETIVRIIHKTNGRVHSKKDAVVKAIQHIQIGRDTVAHDRGIDQRDPADHRYVDGKGEPLSGDQLRSAMRSPARDPSLAAAKRLPVSMKLRMDQRHLSKLLVNCGNSLLPLEVRRVRLDGAPLSDPLGEPLKKEAADKASEEGNQEKRPQTNVPHSLDVTVELDGLIYIYNPVEKEKSAPRR